MMLIADNHLVVLWMIMLRWCGHRTLIVWHVVIEEKLCLGPLMSWLAWRTRWLLCWVLLVVSWGSLLSIVMGGWCKDSCLVVVASLDTCLLQMVLHWLLQVFGLHLKGIWWALDVVKLLSQDMADVYLIMLFVFCETYDSTSCAS